MCREGQSRTPHASILADPTFFGDSTAFKVKEDRNKKEWLMKIPLNDVSAEMKKEMGIALQVLAGKDENRYLQWFKTKRSKAKMLDRAKKQAERERKAKELAEKIKAMELEKAWSNPIIID